MLNNLHVCRNNDFRRVSCASFLKEDRMLYCVIIIIIIIERTEWNRRYWYKDFLIFYVRTSKGHLTRTDNRKYMYIFNRTVSQQQQLLQQQQQQYKNHQRGSTTVIELDYFVITTPREWSRLGVRPGTRCFSRQQSKIWTNTSKSWERT